MNQTFKNIIAKFILWILWIPLMIVMTIIGICLIPFTKVTWNKDGINIKEEL